MTDYLPITDPETDPGAPGTSELWKKWRDNPIAMFEGATDAPRIQVGAFPETTAGNTVKYVSAGAVSNTSGPYSKIMGGKFLGRGSLRIEAVRVAVGSYTRFKIQKNGVDVYTSTSTTAETYTYDLTYAVGDRFSIFHQGSPTAGASTISSVKLKTGGEDLFLLNGLMSPEPNILGGIWY